MSVHSQLTDRSPRWFLEALAAQVDVGCVDAEGTAVAYRAWGPRESPGVVLIHGGAAHSRWWDHVAPLLAEGRRVVAVDLSGHGDSARRRSYTYDLWIDDALAAAHHAGIEGPPVLVGHSMGGGVALRAVTTRPNLITGGIIVDSPLKMRTHEESKAVRGKSRIPLKVYPSFDQAVARYRPNPDAGGYLDYVIEHIARTSLTQVDGGWSWKFDPRIFDREQLELAPTTPEACPLALIRAERGLMSAETSLSVRDRFGGFVPVIELPDATHHAMLDRPLVLVATLRALLAEWADRSRAR